MSNGKELLRIVNLTISYQNHPPAVNNVSFSVQEGDIICIVGESGSGKSTVLRSILGLLPVGGRILSGDIVFQNHNLESCTDKFRQAICGKDISMVFQNAGSHFDPIKKIGKQYDEMLKCHQKVSRSECLRLEKEMLDKVNLVDTDRVLDSYPFELSTGMKQRVAIAMAMTLEPKLLLADEPTSALDVTIQAQVVQHMLELCRCSGTAILIVTHNMGIASFMADYIGVMMQGELIEWGDRDSVIGNPEHNYTKSLLTAIPELTDERFI